MIRRSFVLAVILATLACASPSADRPTPQARQADEASGLSGGSYSTQGGDKPVGVIPDATLRDEKRGRDLELSIEYPIAAGSYPLIVWSHGFGASNRAYVGLSSYWASHGYVVIKPTHADSGKAAGIRSAEEIWESQSATDWRNRAQDVTAILDSIPQLEEKYPEIKGKIDLAHVGVGGHSYGAHTVMLLGGAKTFPGAVSYADPRVKAVLAMSPQGPSDARGLTRESFATLSVPTLFMTGTLDRGISEDETPDWRKLAYELSPAGDKYLVVVEGARHATFSGRVAGMAQAGGTELILPEMIEPQDPIVRDRRNTIPPQSRSAAKRDPQLTERAIFARIKVVSVAFWDAYLHGNAKGKELLAGLDARRRLEMEMK